MNIPVEGKEDYSNIHIYKSKKSSKLTNPSRNPDISQYVFLVELTKSGYMSNLEEGVYFLASPMDTLDTKGHK